MREAVRRAVGADSSACAPGVDAGSAICSGHMVLGAQDAESASRCVDSKSIPTRGRGHDASERGVRDRRVVGNRYISRGVQSRDWVVSGSFTA